MLSYILFAWSNALHIKAREVLVAWTFKSRVLYVMLSPSFLIAQIKTFKIMTVHRKSSERINGLLGLSVNSGISYVNIRVEVDHCYCGQF